MNNFFFGSEEESEVRNSEADVFDIGENTEQYPESFLAPEAPSILRHLNETRNESTFLPEPYNDQQWQSDEDMPMDGAPCIPRPRDVVRNEVTSLPEPSDDQPLRSYEDPDNFQESASVPRPPDVVRNEVTSLPEPGDNQPQRSYKSIFKYLKPFAAPGASPNPLSRYPSPGPVARASHIPRPPAFVKNAVTPLPGFSSIQPLPSGEDIFRLEVPSTLTPTPRVVGRPTIPHLAELVHSPPRQSDEQLSSVACGQSPGMEAAPKDKKSI